ncbi:MAG: hypothetical protein WC054_10360 [Candidatus Nanopelagicales bacterium]
MIDRLGFAPSPPLLVPEVASGAAPELDDLRVACDDMVASLLDGCDHVIILAERSAVGLGEWLLERHGWAGARDVVATDAAHPPSRATILGLSAPHRSTALLVMGDGSACRTQKAPGYFDERAEPFDDALAQHLAEADAAKLTALDQDLAAELLVAGRVTWPIAASVVNADARRWIGDLSFRDDPYGVSYFVALWQPER